MLAIPWLLWNIVTAFIFQNSGYPQDYPPDYPPPGDDPNFPSTNDIGVGEIFWPDFSPTVVWVAFIIGILIYLFGYVAGGKLSGGKILLCVLVATIIGFFSRSLMNPFLGFLVNTFGLSIRTAYVVTSTIWMIYVIGIGVMLYEMFTVTAEEARPD